VEAVPSAALLKKGLDGDDVRVTTAKGARYVRAAGAAGGTFEAMAKKVPSSSAVVALFGGNTDRSASLPALATAAARTVAAVHKQAPSAEIVIVGPLSPGPGSPLQDLITVRNTLRAAAATASVHWVDPIARHWLASSSAVTSGGKLTKAGKQELTRKLTAALAPYTK
jgi:hypothetical protein